MIPGKTVGVGLTTAISARASSALYCAKKDMVKKFDAMLVRYDGWFIVLLAVLMSLAMILLGAMSAWCLMKKHGNFTGNWKWWIQGISINLECR